MNTKKWVNKNIGSLDGKNIVITGATGGLGKKLCLALAYTNANIILACRNKIAAEKLESEIKNVNNDVNVSFFPLDLSSMDSVNNLIENAKKIKIDYLFCNAGVYNVPVKKMEVGYNNIFQINFLSYYYMIKKLMPYFQENKTRVIVTSSIAHNYSHIDPNDIDFSTHKKPSKIYGNSKRYLMFSLYELFKDEENASLSIVHPGITLTNMTNHYPKAINWLVKIGIEILFPSPSKAVRNLLLGITSETPYHTWIGPRYFNIWGKPKLKKIKTAKEQESKKISEIAENIVKKIK